MFYLCFTVPKQLEAYDKLLACYTQNDFKNHTKNMEKKCLSHKIYTKNLLLTITETIWKPKNVSIVSFVKNYARGFSWESLTPSRSLGVM